MDGYDQKWSIMWCIFDHMFIKNNFNGWLYKVHSTIVTVAASCICTVHGHDLKLPRTFLVTMHDATNINCNCLKQLFDKTKGEMKCMQYLIDNFQIIYLCYHHFAEFKIKSIQAHTSEQIFTGCDCFSRETWSEQFSFIFKFFNHWIWTI